MSGIFHEMVFPQVAGEMINRLLDARIPERVASPGIGSVTEEERAFNAVKCQELAVRWTRPQNRVRKDEFLEDIAAKFGW
jgi:hypothetical protein